MWSNEFTSQWIDAGGEDLDLAEDPVLVMVKDRETGKMFSVKHISVEQAGVDDLGGPIVWIEVEEY